MKALLLCAGKGTRLGSLTRHCPKPMLEVGGHPLVEIALRHLEECGFRDVFINLHYHPESLVWYLGDGSQFGVRIRYLYEDRLLGTAGTVLSVRPWLQEEELLVHYGDILTEHDLSGLVAHHCRTDAWATILVHQRPGSNSAVYLDEANRVTRFVERPSAEDRSHAKTPWVFSGICVLGPEAIAALPETTPSDLPRDVFPSLARGRRLYAERLQGYRFAIDSEERLAQARLELGTRTATWPLQEPWTQP